MQAVSMRKVERGHARDPAINAEEYPCAVSTLQLPSSADLRNVAMAYKNFSVTKIQKTGDAEFDAMQIKAFVLL